MFIRTRTLLQMKPVLKFWDDLMQDPNMSFDVAKYATNQWNEYTNPNYYEESTGRNVWATQLYVRILEGVVADIWSNATCRCPSGSD